MVSRLLIACCWATLFSPAGAQWRLAEKLLAADGERRDAFGFSVSLDRATAVIGAPNDDNLIGAAYVFDVVERRQITKLRALDGMPRDSFGGAVSVRDGLALVGAAFDDDPEDFAGSAYLFDARTGEQLLKLRPADSAVWMRFGSSVALGDGVALIGAPGDESFGPYAGSAYLFDTRTGEQRAKLFPDDGGPVDWFGDPVAISGDIAVIGAPGHSADGQPSGHAFLFDLATGRQLRRLIPDDGAFGDAFGWAVAVDGALAIVGAPGDDDMGSASGSVYVFDVASGSQIAKLVASDGEADDRFGHSLALSGSTALVGASGDEVETGSAYVFEARGGRQVAKLSAPDGEYYDRFGQAVALDGSVALAGIIGNNYWGADPGAAYLYFCTADWNMDAVIDTRDIISFLRAWAASDPRADLDGDGVVEFDDFLLFLRLWGDRC